MKSTFKTIAALTGLCLVLALPSKAQWINSGTNIYNSNAGNVGIGSSAAPSDKLQVNGGNILIKGIGNFSANGNEAILKLGDSQNYIKSIFGGGLRIGTYCWNPQTAEAICISQCGNVGIGIVNVGNSKLAVEGRIAAREIKVTTGNFPDYVFEENYKLLSLSDLEQYIEIHKHLPEIPSAKEVSENEGIELGDMQVKVLQKVEEQTLYILSLQHQIDELKSLLNKEK